MGKTRTWHSMGMDEGWWTWLYTFVDLAIYPVLFVEYASFFFPEIAQYKIPICLAIIWMGAGLNILGIVPVGRISMILSVTVVLPFLILFVINVWHHSHSFQIPSLSLKGLGFSSIGMGLYTVMWNFIGWDNTTTYAEEVNKPVRTYLFATFIAFGSTLLIYLIAVITALSSGIDLAILGEEGFPLLGIGRRGTMASCDPCCRWYGQRSWIIFRCAAFRIKSSQSDGR